MYPVIFKSNVKHLRIFNITSFQSNQAIRIISFLMERYHTKFNRSCIKK
jgi:hypothetical protein